MPTPRPTTPDWQRRLKEELIRNKKQTLVLGALLMVGLLVGVRMLKKKPTPSMSRWRISSRVTV